MTQDVIARGGRAKQILDDPMIQEALTSIEQTITSEWQNSPDTDAEGRERCFRALLGLRAFKAFFEIAVESGKLAEHHAEQYRKTGTVA